MFKLRALYRMALVIVVPTALQAMLLGGPEIVSFSVDPTNTSIISITVEDRSHEVLNFRAVSTNGGSTFSLMIPSIDPRVSGTDVDLGQRRYTLADGFLLRSDDSGRTWTNTGARKFVREQTDAAIKKERIEFERVSGARVPFRSEWWTPLFFLITSVHSVLLIVFLKSSRGWFSAIAPAFQSAAILLVVWLMLTAFYEAIHLINEGQWPNRFWNTHAEFNPSLKTGIIMKIAARPTPLLAYLIPISLLLPATIDVVLDRLASPPVRLRLQPALSFMAAVLILSIHVYFAFVGYFTEY